MKKSYFLLSILLISIMAFGTSIVNAQAIKVHVDNRSLEPDVAPIIVEDRTLVPMRAIFEALGASVHWDGETRRVTGETWNKIVVLEIDNKVASVNGKEVELDVPATIVGGRTMVPIRFIGESLGAEVNWEAATSTVSVNSNLTRGGEISEEKSLIDVTGVYTGHIDSSSIEIEVSGEKRAYRYEPYQEWIFNELLNVGDKVALTYYENERGQLIIEKIDKAERAAMVKDVKGVFIGMADSHSVEIKIQGEPQVFGLAEQIYLGGFEYGDEIIFEYYEGDFGRLIINKMNKAE